MCHLVFRAGELVGGNMSYYCSITECTKRQCKGMLKWIKKKFRSNPVIYIHQSTRTCQKTCLSVFPYIFQAKYVRNKKINENKLVGGTTTWCTIWGPVYEHLCNNTINRHTQTTKQLKTKSSTRAEEAKSHYNELITNTI
jgi:hypothetical protein